MSLFQWKDDYLIGQLEIDAQHRRLFQLADQLHAALATDKGRDILGKTLADLIDYTKRHFAAEERLMQRYNYPGYQQHKGMHDKLTAQVVQFQMDFAAGEKAVSIHLLRFLKDWLQHHIGKADRQISIFINQHAA